MSGVRRGAGPRDPMARPIEQPRTPPGRGGNGSGGRSNGGSGGGGQGNGPGNGYARPPRDRYRYPDERRGGSGMGGLLRFLIFLAVMAGLVLTVLMTVGRPVFRSIVVGFAEDSPGALRIEFVRDLVAEDIGPALDAPASDDATEVDFQVESGDTPATLAPKLIDAGVIVSERAFLFHATLDELAGKLDAGHFALTKAMTPEQVVRGLVENRIVIKTLEITFREGLRLEQLTAKLQTYPESTVDPDQFYELVTDPPESLIAEFPWLADERIRPAGRSLEGFLYPATYTVRITGEETDDAEDLVRMMLTEFRERLGPERFEVPEARALSFYQVLTLASIVEREAVLDDERPLIAGVYQNRIDAKANVRHGLLQADPTLLYASDSVELSRLDDWTQWSFWSFPAEHPRLSEWEFPGELAAYNTYIVKGLPPGPICTPSVASIDAALAPDTGAGMNFFVAIPGGDGKHDFSKTLEEHERKVREYNG
jgi:UPF0755 protein